jgi:hypothetical protein
MSQDAGDPVGGAQHSRNLAKESSVESPRDLIDRAQTTRGEHLQYVHQQATALETMGMGSVDEQADMRKR